MFTLFGNLCTIAGLGISIFEYRYTEILKLFSVIFLNTEILKFKPSQFQYYIEIPKFKQSQFRYYTEIPKFKPSQFLYYTEILEFKQSQFQYYIDILKFKPNQFRFFRYWQRFTQSLAKRSHAHTNTYVQQWYSTFSTRVICDTLTKKL